MDQILCESEALSIDLDEKEPSEAASWVASPPGWVVSMTEAYTLVFTVSFPLRVLSRRVDLSQS